ncbi:IucC family-domain-containing protein [Gigaspora margarita]|uniref:IucC family-domain-containing protein n=1 Tax=Gigaspora margarita TaxID=4874 RepID=A0A8H4EV96_GIGMA|nr:IucC family-domain-containing protein [Gigaspora margarita]
MALSPIQRANFATISRLLSCVINEHLVKAFYQSFQHEPPELTNSFAKSSLNHGVIFVLPENDKIDNKNIIIISMLHEPILSKDQENDSTPTKVDFVDPWDMTAPVYQIRYDPFQFVNLDELKSIITRPMNERVEISPSEFMSLLGLWMNLDDDKLIDKLCAELDSSVKFQEYTYKNPQPTPLLSSSIEWEQSLIEGHALHPMHKSRFALPPISEIFPGTYDFRKPTIRFVEVPRDKTYLRGRWEENLNRLLDVMEQRPTCSPNSVLFPVHELQLPNIKEKFSYVKILPIEYSIEAYSQASLRTLVVPDVPGLAFKLSLGITVSSALRTITPWTTHTGPELIPIFKKLYINKEILKISNAVASATVNEQNYDIARHLSCIVREDFNASSENVIICAGLTERDENGISVVEKVWRLDTEEKRVKFLRRYSWFLFNAFLPPALHNGLSFEAHSQNVLARFDSASGQLIGFVVRDFGGIKYHQDTLFASTGLRANMLKDNVTDAKDLIEVYANLYHTLILCHIHRLIRALDLHYSGVGWKIVREHLSEIIPRDHLLWKLWLEDKVTKLKCFIRMKCEELYRDYIYCPTPNLILYNYENEN